MAGIYIHVPFCKTRCIYCDFYSTTFNELKQRYVQALCKELRLRKDYLQGERVETIYLGGGTPSQLEREDLEAIFCTLQEVYGLEDAVEMTIEANPDDLTESYTQMLGTLPINRISMGIQTFHNPTLKLLNRRHSAEQAKQAIANCRKAGFQNISLDLIYGLPGETDERWMNDLKQAIALDVEHVSAYHLTYEEDTRLYQLLQSEQVSEVDEESSVRFFTLLIDELKAAGYEHYEISNFCKPGKHSRHNSSYWAGISYLGCGPSAHSFDRYSRQWNVADLQHYIAGMEKGELNYEKEELDLPTRYNEYIMTGLRTRQGISLATLAGTFGEELKRHCLTNAAPYLENHLLQQEADFIRFTRQGIFVSDGIISELMYL